MPCSVCGLDGHNRRSCSKISKADYEVRDRALILRIDGMTRSEQDEMHTGLVDLKKRVTSDKAKATLVEGSSKELPSKIRALVEKQNDE